jgi:hypothetical protein
VFLVNVPVMALLLVQTTAGCSPTSTATAATSARAGLAYVDRYRDRRYSRLDRHRHVDNSRPAATSTEARGR